MRSPGPARLVQALLAYALALAVVAEFVSGYAILHPAVFGSVIAKPLAFRLHLFVQPLMAFFFLAHFLLAVRGRVRASSPERGKRAAALDALLALAGLALFSVSVYFALRG